MKDINSERVLGFDQIREKLRSYATSVKGKKEAAELELSEDIRVILSDMDLVTEMKKILSSGNFPIHGVKDIDEAVAQLRSPDQLTEPVNLYNIASTLSVARKIYSFIYSKIDKYPSIFEICDELEVFEDVEERIFKAVSSDGEILDTASRELKSIRSKIVNAQNKLRKKTAQVFDQYTKDGYAREGEITYRNGRFVIPVKADKKNRVNGIVVDESATGNTVFVEPYESIEINSELENLHREERKELDRIIRALVSSVWDIKDEVLLNTEILAELDVIYSKAKFSIKYYCNHVKVNTKNIVNIYHGLHPLLVDSHGIKDVVALDLEIGEKFHSMIITGPNAGGKTVTLKTIGLLCMMARAGMHLPTQSNSNIGIFSEIFTDIGDGQSIENDLSTFSSHITKLSAVLRTKTNDTLVLLDEIGASTDPAEGASLSMAIISELTKRKFTTIATTHQGILKSYAYREKGVSNGSMEFDKKNISPTYKFRAGLPGSSYAFEISKRHGLPKYIIDKARVHLGKDKENLEGLISELDTKITNYNKMIRDSKSVNTQLKDLKDHYDKKFTELQKNEKKIMREAAKKAKEVIAQSNKMIENAVSEIKSNKADKEVVKKVREKIQKEEKKLNILNKDISDQKKSYDGELKVGMEVEIKNFSSTGIINEIKGKNVEVAIGDINLRIKQDQIVSVIKGKKEDISVSVTYTPTSDTAKLALDLRGKRGDEAIAMLEKHIESMVLNNLSFSEIIHGKGEGILSKLVNEYLAMNPHVKRKKFGEYGEGDYGVTVIELK
ncbi:MAG: endonuclease MutS2 [Candidatus Delongbacteria bacterium]|nr:endonuclease MutS2 [Candidatus Delongbacteria bacterium]